MAATGRWQLLTGLGVAAAVYAAWSAAQNRRRTPGEVGAYAWLVPLPKARTEAQWTQRAVAQQTGSKNG